MFSILLPSHKPHKQHQVNRHPEPLTGKSCAHVALTIRTGFAHADNPHPESESRESHPAKQRVAGHGCYLLHSSRPRHRLQLLQSTQRFAKKSGKSTRSQPMRSRFWGLRPKPGPDVAGAEGMGATRITHQRTAAGYSCRRPALIRHGQLRGIANGDNPGYSAGDNF